MCRYIVHQLSLLEAHFRGTASDREILACPPLAAESMSKVSQNGGSASSRRSSRASSTYSSECQLILSFPFSYRFTRTKLYLLPVRSCMCSRRTSSACGIFRGAIL